MFKEKNYSVRCGCMASVITARTKFAAVRKFKSSGIYKMLNLKGVKITAQLV